MGKEYFFILFAAFTALAFGLVKADQKENPAPPATAESVDSTVSSSK